MKRGYKLRDDDQVPTRPATLDEIMGAPRFAQGVADQRRRDVPIRTTTTVWKHTNDRWDYSRGRQWATVAPRHVVLKVNGKVTTTALRWYACEEIL